MPRSLSPKVEVAVIVVLALVPLFIHLPYRVNIFLSWEGAYRISEGQLPFRDFGIPLGGMYWMIPALFFKIFGPNLATLIKAQVFINILSGLAFRSILKSLSVGKSIRLAAVALFCLSYSFFNFWPWYNHSVIVYELIALSFLLRWIMGSAVAGRYHWLNLVAAAFFTACSFLTKQDGGGVAVMLALVLLAVNGWMTRKWLPVLVFAGSFAVLFLLLVAPYLSHGFGYWFNHGQPPHSARVSAFDFIAEFFGASQWIKFYFFIIVLLALIRYRELSVLKSDPAGVFTVLLTLGILGEAAVLQVTSYTPPDNNIFFHSFAFACILSQISAMLPVRIDRPVVTVLMVAGIFLWWSDVWWKYTQRLVGSFAPKNGAAVSPTGENVINKDTYMINTDTARDVPTDKWVECGLPAFRKITMPEPTAAGIQRLMKMDIIKSGKELKVLNMSELTPLAAEIPYKLERNSQLPLWYHLGVGMFNRQADTFETRIRDRYYDVILFEYIPTLNNFYPFRVRDSLRLHYPQVDSFPAPRRGLETQGVIEVFVKPAR
ncbi:MAG: hypothetical protein JST68_24810 [Bacteroidetes bacterium]|nr:hypothetical protein [Bacteroidota bacterium]